MRKGETVTKAECAPPDRFGHFAGKASMWLGSKWAFACAGTIILIWGIAGPVFHYSDTWQLIINTGTTIVTFLMVFLIQNTQNRGARAINLKLDELIRAVDKAHNRRMNIERLSDVELDVLEKQFDRMRSAGGLKQEGRSKHEAAAD